MPGTERHDTMSGMSGNLEHDPVMCSVAAYSKDPFGYARRYADHLLDRPARFASLLPPAARILDLGCGPGRDLRLFSDAGHTAIGVELNPHFVAMARHHGEVVEADIRRIGELFAPRSFSGVWAQASLVHLSGEDIELLLLDLAMILEPAGRLYACVPSFGETGWWDEPDGRRWYTVWPRNSFVRAVETAGFAVDDVTAGPYVEVWAIAP